MDNISHQTQVCNKYSYIVRSSCAGGFVRVVCNGIFDLTWYSIIIAKDSILLFFAYAMKSVAFADNKIRMFRSRICSLVILLDVPQRVYYANESNLAKERKVVNQKHMPDLHNIHA